MLESVMVQCPYCGEPFETFADCSAGDAAYIEDCPVCCAPIEFALTTTAGGELIRLVPRRQDD